MKKWRVRCFGRGRRRALTLTVIGVLWKLSSKAQTADGNNGIQEANNLVRKYYGDATNLMYGVAGVLALIGAIKVYGKWSHGDPDTGKVAAAWFGSCIFLVVVATVIKQFFGIS
jgi:hypothetical protein